MGKGDKKSKRGKIIKGSYGVRRPRKKTAVIVLKKKTAKPKPKAPKEEPEEKTVAVKKPAEKKVAAKKPAAKKTSAKKTTAEKPTAEKSDSKTPSTDSTENKEKTEIKESEAEDNT